MFYKFIHCNTFHGRFQFNYLLLTELRNSKSANLFSIVSILNGGVSYACLAHLVQLTFPRTLLHHFSLVLVLCNCKQFQISIENLLCHLFSPVQELSEIRIILLKNNFKFNLKNSMLRNPYIGF